MQQNNLTRQSNQSFTLIELLVVLALVAILSVVVVVTLNPAELIKQARDSNRLSDLSTINTALNLFSADVTSGFMGTSTIVYVSIPDTSPTCANLGLPTSTTYTYNCVTTANLRNTNGTGWIPVNFQRISSNSPISQLPIDPTNTTSSGNYYTYMTGGSWELASNMESIKQKSATGASGTDGGVSLSSYEIGNNLRLIPSGLLEWKRDSSLVGYWTFDEGNTTTVKDYSGYEANGLWYGTSTARHEVGKVGAYSGYFNGSSDYYLLNEKFSFIQKTGKFTISAWVKFYDPARTTQYFIGNSPGNNEQGFFHGVMTGNLASVVFTASGGGYVFSSRSSQSMPTNNSWINIILVADGSTAKYYVNGIADSSVTNIATFSNEESTRNLTIGKINTYDSGLFGGNLDDVRVYDRALSAAELLALYNATK